MYCVASRRRRRRRRRRRSAVNAGRRRRRRHGAGGRRSGSSGVDELGDACEPAIMSGLSGPIAQQLLRHEQSCLRSGLAVAPARGGGRGVAVGRLQLLRGTKGGGLLFSSRVGRGDAAALTRVGVDDGLSVDPARCPAVSAFAASFSHGDATSRRRASTPYLARQMSEFCPRGITHSTRFEHRGLKHAVSRSSSSLGRGKTRRTEGRRREFTQVQATVRCNTLLLLVWIAMLAELQYNGELTRGKVSELADPLFHPCYGRGVVPYIGAPVLFPQIFRREGLPHSSKRGYRHMVQSLPRRGVASDVEGDVGLGA